MKWAAFLFTAFIAILIILFQWPKVKQLSRKDKAAFIGLLLIGLVLSMFDLQHIQGPVTWIEALFKPLADFLEL